MSDDYNAQLGEIRLMTAEMLATTRTLAPTLAALDARLDQLERANIRTEGAIAALAEKLDDKLDRLGKLEQRVKSLEDDRIKLKAWAGLLAALAATGGFLVEHFWPK